MHTGLFGTSRTFVPLSEAAEGDGSLTVPFEKATVKDAPKVEANGQLTREEEAALTSTTGSTKRGRRHVARAPG